MSVIFHCPLDIWWLMQQISKYSHNAVVFEELLAMETQGHLRGGEWGGKNKITFCDADLGCAPGTQGAPTSGQRYNEKLCTGTAPLYSTRGQGT